ncbi:Eburicol 14-alpha-demethylase [Beauveria bassiana]|uniref:Eburicol 14-alpha-demethylase n=1 Tax=Beauveria bassiana TaxID=176275 RepID=A0A2N6NVI9_BEABA|nr:Eburicol 14-alpha-demethylase [Beauveria bassiana]
MAEITIFTAGRSLQGAEVRRRLTGEFAELYHDLDLGFRPINFLMPWAPLPQNRRRDLAHGRMRDIYMELINERRKASGFEEVDDDEESDMIRNLMQCVYKNGQALPDKEIAHMMITLLMAGQHSSSSSSAWIMLRLASRPDIAEELYQELKQQGFGPLHRLQYADLDKLQLLSNVVKETLRVHSSIHSIMRKVKQPMRVPDSDYVITPDKVLVASPIMTHLNEDYFRNAQTWDPHRWDDEVEAEEDDIVDYGYGATSKGTKSSYLPFGAGRHRCIGEKFAYLNLATIISTLVRHFKFATLDGKVVVPPTDYTSLFSRPTQPAVGQRLGASRSGSVVGPVHGILMVITQCAGENERVPAGSPSFTTLGGALAVVLGSRLSHLLKLTRGLGDSRHPILDVFGGVCRASLGVRGLDVVAYAQSGGPGGNTVTGEGHGRNGNCPFRSPSRSMDR